jgi:hypothetical protein
MSAIIDPVIGDQLNRFARRQRWWILCRAALIALAVWIVAVLFVTWVDAAWVIERGPRSLLTLATYAVAAAVFLALAVPRLRGDEPLRRAALAVEGARPDMRDRLLSAVELAGAAEKSKESSATVSGLAFIEAAQRDVALRINRLDVRELLPVRLLQRPMLIAAVLFAAAASLALIPNLNYGNRFARAIIPGIDLDRVSRTRIRITRPEPASRSVPANELTAITIETLDYPAQKAILQWQADTGQRGSITMNLIDDGETMAVTGEPMTRLAANLPVQESTMRYRILAGDGVTAWQKLEPRPRPTARDFEIAVTPPDYARMPVRTTTASGGDLRVIRGSRVTLAITFDMPVVDAFIRLVGDDDQIPMTGQADRWSATMLVTQDDRYQVLARSADTGFDNPLSPQYAIVAETDLPPIVAWSEVASQTTEGASAPAGASAAAKKRLVTSRATVSLRATARDEMPLDRLFQEFAINRDAWQLRPLEDATEMAANIDKQWDWNLASIAGENRTLSPGDLIRTRVVAVDRLGQRGESEVREYLISDQALDVRRRNNVRAWADLAAEVSRWQTAVAEEAIRLGIDKPKDDKSRQADPADPLADEDAKLASIAELTKSILAKLVAMTPAALHDSEAGEIELLARAIWRIDAEMIRAESVDTDKREPFKRVSRAAQYVENAVKQSVAHRLAVTLAEDFDRMVLSMQPLADPDGAIQWQSFAPYHQVTQQQFRESLALIKEFEKRIPESTVNHNEQLRRWIDSWLQRLAEHDSPDVGEQRTRATTNDLIKDLSSRRRYGMIDGRLPSLIIESHNHLIDFAGWTTVAMQEAADLSRSVRRLRDGEALTDSDKAIEATAMNQRLMRRLGEIGRQVKFDAEANLRRPGADRRYVADARLMQRVLDTIAADDFVLPDEKRFDDVVEEIKTAFYQLEAGHWWTQWLSETRGLADTERWDIDSSSARIDAPMRWERIHRGLDQSLGGLDRASISWELRQPLHHVVHSREQSKIASTITSRRWQNVTATSLGDSIDALHESLVAAGQSIGPAMADARRRLEAYLPDLAEMARDTAKQLRTAEELAKQPEQAKPKEAADQLSELQKQIAQQAEKLREALIDEANTQDLISTEGLQKARDADIATRAIDQQMKAASEATAQAVQTANEADDATEAQTALQTAAQPLATAAQTLEKIAEHYENRAQAATDSADPTAAEPSSLASLEQELGLTKQLDQEFARSQALSEALRSDPREMLEKLSQELKRNELMRNELDRIAERSLQDAQQALKQAADRERQLQLELERQDPQVMAEKRQLEDAIRSAADNTDAVQRAMMHTAKQAASRLNGLPEPLAKQAEAARNDLENASQQLQQAMQSAAVQSAEQELLSDLRNRAAEVKDKLASAIETLAKSEAEIDSLRKNPESAAQGEQQKSEQRDMQNLQRQTRDTLAGSVRNLQNRASQMTSQSEQASRQAKSQEQQAERQLSETQKRLEKDPDNQDLKRDVARAQARAETEKQRVAVAENDVQRRREMVENARERLAEIGRTPLLPLESQRPAAELVQAMQQRAAEDLKAQQAALQAAVDRAAGAPELKADGDQLQATAQSQADVQADVQRAAENLQRAARHQERLGDRDSSELTASVAEAVQNAAQSEVAQAQAEIAQAANEAMAKAQTSEKPIANAQQAREMLANAEQAIADQAEALLEAIAQVSENAAMRAQQAQDAADQRATAARQMAQTLDELDRSLNQSRQPPGDEMADGQPQDGQSQDGQAQPPGEGQQPGQQAQSGQQGQPGQQGQQQQPGGPSDQTNMSSPTLADAARRQMQQMAMNRTLPGEGQPSDPSGPQPGEGEPQDGQPGEGLSQMSGPGNRGSDAESFRLNDLAGDGKDDWGKLRSLEAEDTSVQRRVDVSPEYRRQIEAYFRVIAEKAREK